MSLGKYTKLIFMLVSTTTITFRKFAINNGEKRLGALVKQRFTHFSRKEAIDFRNTATAKSTSDFVIHMGGLMRKT
jgi:hypothetical protein